MVTYTEMLYQKKIYSQNVNSKLLKYNFSVLNN